MKRFRSTTLVLLLIALSVIATGCGGSPTPAPTPLPTPQATATAVPSPTSSPSPTATPTIPPPSYGPVTILDSNGREVVFQEPPQRIIAYDSAVVEILFALGEGQRIVATHDFVSYPPETEDIPKLGGAFNMSIEQAVALEPDLVLLLDMAWETGMGRVEGRSDGEGRRFEEEPASFHGRVRDGYLAQARADPERWLVVDGALAQEQVAETIWGGVEPLVKGLGSAYR